MNDKALADLSDDELLAKWKKERSTRILSALLIGIFVGVALYSAVTNGFAFATFFPLFFAYILLRNGKKSRALEQELAARNLQ